MTWRVARSLDILLSEVNASAPNRSKAADGSIGDAAHATRSSDHNPFILDGDVGVVRARDYTHDPAGGFDAYAFAEHVRTLGLAGHPALQDGGYVISNRRIASAVGNWAWRPYSGVNAHAHHTHVSVGRGKGAYDSDRSWGWAVAPKPTAPLPVPVAKVLADPEVKALQSELNRLGEHLDTDGIWGPASEAGANRHVVRLGSKGAAARLVQAKLAARGWKIVVDGDFGPKSVGVLKTFQLEKLGARHDDGVCGARTYLALWNSPVS
jgi:hypothetical protein